MNLVELEKILNKEIEVIDQVEKLFIEKKDVLIKSDIEALKLVDDKIQMLSQKALEIQKERLNVCNCSINDLWGHLEEKGSISLGIKKIKEQFQQKTKSVELLSKTIEELLVHGMKLVNSDITIIINSVMPKINGYDKTGKSKDSNTLGLSSVIKRV